MCVCVCVSWSFLSACPNYNMIYDAFYDAGYDTMVVNEFPVQRDSVDIETSRLAIHCALSSLQDEDEIHAVAYDSTKESIWTTPKKAVIGDHVTSHHTPRVVTTPPNAVDVEMQAIQFKLHSIDNLLKHVVDTTNDLQMMLRQITGIVHALHSNDNTDKPDKTQRSKHKKTTRRQRGHST
jgi:hypothetical protein